ncbi:MAG: magnesium transporter [Planctomycetota bacterium]
MKSLTALLLPDIRELIQQHQPSDLREVLSDIHPADIADMVETLDLGDATVLLAAQPAAFMARIFEQVHEERQLALLRMLGRDRIISLIEEMASDDRADLIKALPERTVDSLLPLLAQVERNDIRRLVSYEEGTVGSLMTTEYASLSADLTVAEALSSIRKVASNKETIYYVFITDNARRLVGVVSLRELVLARPDERIGTIMTTDPIYSTVDEDQAEIARTLEKYDLLAVPVLDREHKLVGIVTADDVIDVLIEEHTEDSYRYGAAGEPVHYATASPWRIVRERITWLVLLVLTMFVSTYALAGFESMLQQVAALAFFIPLLMGSGGNAATQSSTTIIRGLATGDVEVGHIKSIMKKEAVVGLSVGLILSALAILRGFLVPASQASGQVTQLAFTLGITMVVVVTFATVLGATLPLLFKHFGLDPALMSGPFITSVLDILTILLYLTVAWLLMRF